MIKVRFSSEELEQYRVYSLCCHALLGSYEDLLAACDDVDLLIGRFDTELRWSYCEDYESTIECVAHSLDKLIKSYGATAPVRDALAVVQAEILANAGSWDVETAVRHMRDIGKGLAREFYQEGERSKNLGLIECNDPDLILSNACLSNRGRSGYGKARGIIYWRDSIHLPFCKDFEFYDYVSYPFLLFHEYASEVYAPKTRVVTFRDGWMVYAIELFMKTRWARLCRRYPLIGAQWNDLRKPWLHEGRLARKGYEMALRVDLWTDEFLDYITWDLASYPEDFAGHESFHWVFLNVIKPYVFDDGDEIRGPLLRSMAADSTNAQQLYAKLRANL